MYIYHIYIYIYILTVKGLSYITYISYTIYSIYVISMYIHVYIYIYICINYVQICIYCIYCCFIGLTNSDFSKVNLKKLYIVNTFSAKSYFVCYHDLLCNCYI